MVHIEFGCDWKRNEQEIEVSEQGGVSGHGQAQCSRFRLDATLPARGELEFPFTLGYLLINSAGFQKKKGRY
jgi:hypothetical protein